MNSLKKKLLIACNSPGEFDKNSSIYCESSEFVFHQSISENVSTSVTFSDDDYDLTLAIVVLRGQRASCNAFHRSQHLHQQLKRRCSCHRGINVRKHLET